MRNQIAGMRRAFTLVEIMIVVTIIGVLLAVAAPQFLNAREGSSARSCQANLKNILGAKERWAMDTNQGATATPTVANLVRDYLKVNPECPGGGVYTLDRLDNIPTCSIGGVRGEFSAHVLP